MKHLKRKRKSNYSVKETQTLIREIHKRREILFSRQQNMAINELKRRAWEEVADSVNALGEGELRTAAEVKRRYLDWRALMKRKQLQAELASGLKQEFEASSPDNDTSLGGGDQSLDLSGFSKDSSCDWQDLTDLGEPSTHTSGVKTEDDEASTQLFSTLIIIRNVSRGRVPEVFAHIDEFGMLSSTKPTLAGGENTGVLVALERQRLDLEKHRLQVESERLQVEKERLLVEKERLRQGEVERERLQLEKERLQVERERLRLLLEQNTPLQKLVWPMVVDLEAEKLKLEKERLLLEKERLQFFKFESGRLQIEKERLQVEKERLQLHKDGQQMALHS
uniref:Myb/SANT-like DNA-binding domain-containing protein 4 n=1 Tax=Sinocyclocheilus rhinocerous TaxID=307959 RepID=A0A673MAY6_9TELE